MKKRAFSKTVMRDVVRKMNQIVKRKQSIGFLVSASLSWLIVSLIFMHGGFSEACILIPISPFLLFTTIVTSKAYTFLAISAMIVGWVLVIPGLIIIKRRPVPLLVLIIAHTGIGAYMLWSLVLLGCELT